MPGSRWVPTRRRWPAKLGCTHGYLTVMAPEFPLRRWAGYGSCAVSVLDAAFASPRNALPSQSRAADAMH